MVKNSLVPTDQLKVLTSLNYFLAEKFPTYFLGNMRRGKQNWSQNWSSIANLSDSTFFKFYIVVLENLQTFEVKLSELAKVHIQINDILKFQNMIHFIIVDSVPTSKQRLVYE